MKIKDAKLITGHASGLGKPSKMPGFSTGIPAAACKVGSKLAAVAGSVCSGCYALKYNYLYPSVRQGHEARLAALTHPLWIDGMTLLISRYCAAGDARKGFFRWHDSGDLQSLDHFLNIIEVCQRTPGVRHWLPTRELKLLWSYDKLLKQGMVPAIPGNITIRVSAPMIGSGPVKVPDWCRTSTVDDPAAPRHCPAPEQGGKCGDCRACWRLDIANVDYHKH
jgi:hypothetical protein